MPEHHPHVDLKVLKLVEGLLSRGEDAAEVVEEDAELALVPPTPPTSREQSATHPAAHVPEQPLIAKEPVTPLSRRR
jgi:hypothetical protein